MSLTGDLITYIGADTAIKALIGTKIFDLYVPEDTTYPYVSLVRESMTIEDYLEGTTPLRQSMYSCTIVSDSSISGEAVEEALIALLASLRGTVGTSRVRVIYYQGSTDSFIPPVDMSEESIHLIELGFEVHWFST